MIIRQAHDKYHKGFTFVELLVVITIIGVIFASGIVAYSSITVRSRDVRRRSDLESIRQSLEMCRSLTGAYPQNIDTNVSCSASGPVLMATIPTDPKTSETCVYTYTPVAPTYTSYTLTACQEVGGIYQVASP
jgi:prepilin-type N-terminal cleavage/methylation domain-containing protein